MIIQSLVRHIEQSYYLMKEGALKESTYVAAMSNACNILAYPGAKDWWITRREFFDADFAESLASYMKEYKSKDIYKIRPNK